MGVHMNKVCPSQRACFILVKKKKLSLAYIWRYSSASSRITLETVGHQFSDSIN